MNGGHNLLIGFFACGTFKLCGQTRQLLGIGRIMAHHVLH